MNLSDLPVEDRELVLALIDIASIDCRDLSWSDLEPILSACWDECRGESHRRTPALTWNEVAAYVRAACDETANSQSNANAA